MLGVAFADVDDPPGRVARLSYVQGSVSLQPAGQEDWVGAELNRPLTTNDKLWSDATGSRAELDVGGAAIRVGPNTGFSFLNLDDSVAQMQVTAGTVIVRVRELLENQTYEVDTPNIALVLDQPGQYRVEVSDTGESTVVRVSEGQAEATGGGQSFPVNNQQEVTFTGSDEVEADANMLGAPDGFDDWSFERDREYERSVSRQYVAEGIAGAEDLDENGRWEDTPDYGPVWVPTAVAVGWAPYSFGHWAWISPWGWTWVDNASWGFAPFHYGRWARWRDSWCWVPGPRRVRPVYAPAMVAWVGGRAGGAGVGWFPLGPREVYVPGYRVSDRYVRSINITNTRIVNQMDITNVYQNRGANIRYANSAVPGAVTAVSRNVFTSAQPVNSHRINLPPGQMVHSSASPVPPAISPVRQSILGGGAANSGFGRRPPQAIASRAVVARTPPPPASTARVRLVGPTPSPARPVQQRLPIQQRPTAVTPQPSEVDSRNWANRAHAIGQPSLPPSQPPRLDHPPMREGGGGVPEQGRVVPNGSFRENEGSQALRPGEPSHQTRLPEVQRGIPGGNFRDNRPPSVSQPEHVEQPRPPVNTYTRPQMERPAVTQPQFQERRPAPASPPPAPVPRFAAPSPPPGPVPRFTAPSPAPALVPSSPPVRAPAPPQMAAPSRPQGPQGRPAPERPAPRPQSNSNRN